MCERGKKELKEGRRKGRRKDARAEKKLSILY
jgi:hypothetical protein